MFGVSDRYVKELEDKMRISKLEEQLEELNLEIEDMVHTARSRDDEISDLRGSCIQLQSENKLLRHLMEVSNRKRAELNRLCNEQGKQIDELNDLPAGEVEELKVKDECIKRLRVVANKAIASKAKKQKRIEELEYKLRVLENYYESQEEFDSNKLDELKTERDLAVDELGRIKNDLRKTLGLM